MNGRGSGSVSPSIVTWASSMASSSAAWVFGGVRLISSASSIEVNTGPLRSSKRPSFCRNTMVPVRSAGIRSGVNWMRV